MNLLQGIQLHELILMILGFILGLALIFIFLYTALKSKPNLKLLYGFAAPLVMIGYPSIRSVEFGKDVIKIDKLVEQVNQNPTDTLAQQALIQNIQTLPASRCKTSPDALATIANAQAALGQYDSAKVYIQKAIELDNNSTKAVESGKDIDLKWQAQKVTEQKIQQIDNIVKKVQASPNDKNLKLQLSDKLTDLQNSSSRPVHIDNKRMLVVAQAVSMVGQPQQAIEITNEVLKVHPDQPEAEKLQAKIKQRIPERKPRINTTTESPNSKNRTADAAKRIETVPAPAPVYQDTQHLNFRLIPKAGIDVKKFWNSKE